MNSDEQFERACAIANGSSASQAVNLVTDGNGCGQQYQCKPAISGRWRCGIFLCIAISAFVPGTANLHAAPAATDGEATSSRAARDEALRAIPWQNITPEDRRRAHFVIQNTSIYRRLPTRVIDCDPEMFAFLIQHPEVVIDVWQLMGISRITLDKTPDGSYRCSDGAGTTGMVRYLATSFTPDAKTLAVIYADGAYDGKPFPTTLKAKSILVLRTSAVQETNGRSYITVRLDSFVHVEQMGFELVAKTVQPWLNKTADQNFIETLSFISNFSRTAEKNPQGMQRLSSRLPSIDEPTRAQLVQLCFRAADRYAQRQNATRTSATLLARRPEVALNYAR
jgi:hypothetical protein